MRRKPRWGWVVAVALGLWLIASPSDSDESTPEQPAGSTAESRSGGDQLAGTPATDHADDRRRDRSTPAPSDTSPETHRDTRRPERPRPEPVPPAERSFVVTRVVDGDTVELGNGEHVRLVGIDTPERGECGFEEAAAALSQAVLGREVLLRRSDEDRDGYGRLLRYVDVGPTDSGLGLIRRGLAIARYDSRDGYGFHPREPRYVAADRGSTPLCPARPSTPPRQTAHTGGGAGGGVCAPGYQPCVPPAPPDLDCADVDGPVLVSGSDPHGLDGDGDGTACE